MIGKIKSFDENKSTGTIQVGEKSYTFALEAWNSDTPPKVGNEVDFMPEDDDSANSIDILKGYIQNSNAVKNRYIAGFLGLIFGFVGLHRVYLGFYPIAIAQAALSFGLGFQYGFMWGAIEGALILNRKIVRDVKGRPLKG